VAALEALLLCELFLVVDVAETAWNLEIEEQARQADRIAGWLTDTAGSAASGS